MTGTNLGPNCRNKAQNRLKSDTRILDTHTRVIVEFTSIQQYSVFQKVE